MTQSQRFSKWFQMSQKIVTREKSEENEENEKIEENEESEENDS